MCTAEVGSASAVTENPQDRVKFLCSFGGAILPRPSDGKLRYAGGETRIVAVGRDVSYRELMLKLAELCENEGFCLKYQQPDDDLDALVSVMSDEDVCHMMEEYDRLEASDGVSGRLRLFLFANGEKTLQQQENLASSDGSEEQRYVEALNSVAEINRHQIENDKNSNICNISGSGGGIGNIIDNNLCSSNNNCNSGNKDNSLVGGNGIEPGVAQHVSVALPVSLMRAYSKGFGGSPTSPSSSPSHHHLYSQQHHHQHKQIVSPELYFRKQSGHHNIQYVHNSSNLGQPEPCFDPQGQPHHYLSHSESQHHDHTSKGQSEYHSHHPSAHSHGPLLSELSDISNLHHHHMPRHESFQNMKGLDMSKGNPEQQHQQHHYHMPQRESFTQQSDYNSHHHQHMPGHDSFQDTQGRDSLSKGHLDHYHQQHGHHHGQELHGQESYRVSSPVVPGVEVPLKGQVEVDGLDLHLSPRVESHQGIQAASVVEFPLKRQYEGDSYHLHLSQRVESHQGIQAPSGVEFPLTGQYGADSYHQQDVATLSRVEFPMKLQPEVGCHMQHSPRMQSNVVSHFQHGPTNVLPQQQETYWETAVQPGVEFPHKGQSNVGSGVHAGFVGSREYKHNMVDTFVTHVESPGDLQLLELQHVNFQSEVAANVFVVGDGKLHNIPSRQCNLHHPNCSGQQEMPHMYHQAAQSSSNDQNDQNHNSTNQHSEFVWSNSTQRRAVLHPLCRQSEQVQLMHNNNELHQGAFIDHKFMYRDQHELVQSNLLQKNAFPHSMGGHVEQQLSRNDVEIERSWNASYYASSPQISHGFNCISHSDDVIDFHLASMSTAHEVSSGNTHERYVENRHYVQVPLAPDEHGNLVDYTSNGNMAPLTSRPSPNNYVSSGNHMKWHDKPHFSEKDIDIQGHNLSQLQKTFEGNHFYHWQYDEVQSCENRPEFWVPISISEQSLLYSDRYGEYADYYPVASEELPFQNMRVDQTEYTVQPPDEPVDHQDGQEKVRERVLHLMNDPVDQLRMFVDVKANGAPALGQSIHNIIGQNDSLDYYPIPYQGVNPDDDFHMTETDDFHRLSLSNQYEHQIHKALPAEAGAGHGKFVDVCARDNLLHDMESLELGNAPQSKLNNIVIETHMGCTFGIHLDSNNAQRHDFHIVGENEIMDSVLGKTTNEDVQRMEHDYMSHGRNISNVTNFPDYMPKDVFKKNPNTSDSDGHSFMGSQFTPKIEFLTVEHVKRHAHFESETGIPCVSNALATAENNQIPSSGSFSQAVTSTVASVPDKPTIQVLSMASPYISYSSPKGSDNMTSTTPPIYDKSPSNSMTAALPENFWSETEEGRKPSELDKNVIIENKTMMSNTTHLAVEHDSIDLQEPMQDENVDSIMHQNHLSKGDGNICGSRPIALHVPSIPSISEAKKSKNLNEQESGRNDKEVVTGMDCKEVKDEDVLYTSDVEENIAQQEDTENTLGLDEDTNSNLVDMARKASIEAEAEALAKELQTIRNADLEEIRELGSGTYGTVYYGKWKGSDVAIKRIKASCFEGSPSQHKRLIADFWKEASILSQLHHPNVVSFYGVVRDGPGATLATVTEFMVNGSLKQVLRKKDRTIDRRKRLILAMDAAFGMEYLHEKNVVHFDLKCENLLVNMRDPHRPICKIGDMGLSKVKHQTLVSGGVRGTLPWMAPELLGGKSGVSNKIDVYSFGIVMWELLTGDEPYANMHCGSIIGGIMKNTLRPPIPDWCEPAWRSLMEKCWSADPEERPSFSEISKELRAVAASMNLK